MHEICRNTEKHSPILPIGGALIGALLGLTIGAILTSPSKRKRTMQIMRAYQDEAKQLSRIIQKSLDNFLEEERRSKRREERNNPPHHVN